MKKGKMRVLAWLLCASMLLSTSAMASGTETSGDDRSPAKGQENGPSLLSLEIAADRTAADTWEQDPDTVAGNDAICVIEDGRLHLKAGSGNNNGDKPAVFINETMSAALRGVDQATGTSFVEVTFTPVSSAADSRFGIYLGYQNPAQGLFIGADSGGWFWQKYGASGNPWYTGSRVASPAPGQSHTLRLEWQGTQLTKATVNGQDLFGDLSGFDFSGTLGTETKVTQVAFKASTYSGARTEYYISNLTYSGQAMTTAYSVSGTVTGPEDQPVENAQVTINGISVYTNSQGAYSFEGDNSLVPGTYTMTVSCDGYTTATKEITVTNSDLSGQDIVLVSDGVQTTTLTSDTMTVTVDRNFPRVIQYQLKSGEIFYGQSTKLDTLLINGVSVTPSVTSQVDDDSQITYTMTATDSGSNINAVITARLKVEGNTLGFYIDSITNNLDRISYPVERISIPNHSLISVRTSQNGANLKAARLASNTMTSGDSYVEIAPGSNLSGINNQNYLFAFLSNNELSAGLSSNSEYGSASGGSNNYPVLVNVEDKGAYQSVGLSSTEWYYDRKVSSGYQSSVQNPNIPTEQSVVGPTELPFYAEVVITGDQNGDNSVDWQDGAIAFRDTILHIPTGGEEVRDIVGTRIAMNFGSQAQNPFLTTLDNVKRVALNTDGLGQAILLKGYASEGHDSGHPDYFDIGERMGGAEDMLTMLTEGKKLGARFGIHVNASEFYPEADSFDENLVKRNADGSLAYGWNWIDQGINMNGLYDLATGLRENRFDQLAAIVGTHLNFVYVDVWGNGQSGTEDAWQTHKLSEMITSNGWRIAHEWAFSNPRESTFQHWVADFSYGDYTHKGKYNSEVIRFLLNSYKDSFPPDFPHYGGASNAPLLGGPVMQGFEGWQGDAEYNLAITTIFDQLLPTKFLQHYDIMSWENASAPVTLPYTTGAGNSAMNQSGSWTPEVQIKLEDDAGNKVVVTRDGDGDGQIDDSYSYETQADQIAYRSRTITLNGKVIAKGAPAAGGEDNAFPASLATQTYLIPWYWDSVTGAKVAREDEKLYHWNDQDGTTRWELPDDWSSLSSVYVYTLTDQGRTDMKEVQVEDGRIELTAEAQTPYVVVRGQEGGNEPQITWSTGMHLVDVSFNDANLSAWTTTGDAEQYKLANEGLVMLKMSGEASVSQTMTDLTPDARYAVYVGVDNRSDAKASITLTDSSGNVLASNYTLRSIAKNYISAYSYHNGHPVEAGSSYFQNMYVFFTAPDDAVTLTLSREAGEGNTYFDDVRVVEGIPDGFTYDDQGNVTGFTQDFENVAQGEYPFVCGPIEGVADNRQHPARLNAPFTQAGWDVKKMDDVLEGEWSLKVNGLVQSNNLVFQTIPQNFHFEPGVTYTISFDYQMGSPGIYKVVYGEGAYGDATLSSVELQQSLGKTATCTFTMVGGQSGQSWFGIYSTSTAPDYQGATGSAQNFGGYKEIVIDNVSIQVSSVQKGELAELLETAEAMTQPNYIGDWDTFAAARDAARLVMDDQQATAEAVNTAYNNLKAAMDALKRIVVTLSGLVVDQDGNPVAGAQVTLEDSQYLPVSLTATTDETGSYSFDDSSLLIQDYMLKVDADGYLVQTVPVTTTGYTRQDIALVTDPELSHKNDFSSDASGLFAPLDSGVSNPTTATWEDGAVTVTFNNNDRAASDLAYTGAQFTNGTISMDVTPTGSTTRFGINLRSTNNNNRIYVGLFDGQGIWGWEYWNNGTNSYSAGVAGPELKAGVTRNIRITLDGSTMSLYVDGVPVFENADMGNPPTNEGYVGFNGRNLSGSSFVIDNLWFSEETEQTESEIVVTFNTLGGAVVPTQLLASGETVTKPEDPTMDGYTCEGWYSDPELTAAYDFETPVTGDLILYAKWSEVSGGSSGGSSGSSSGSNVVVKDENGEIIRTGKLSQADVKAAEEAGLPLALPIPALSVDSNWEDAHTVTVTLPKKGEILVEIPVENLLPGDVAVLVKADGTEELVKTSFITDNGVAVRLNSGESVKIVDNSRTFLDVPAAYWGADAIDYVTARELFSGTGEDAFSPDLAMSRAMMVTVLARFHGVDTSGGSTWYEVGAQWAVENGVSDGRYLEENLTREQMVTMLWRYVGEPEATADLSVFTDAGDISGYARQAMEWAVENGIIVGTSSSTITPQGLATRAQVAAVYMRLIQQLKLG